MKLNFSTRLYGCIQFSTCVASRQKLLQHKLTRMFSSSSYSHGNTERMLQRNCSTASGSNNDDISESFKLAMRKVPQQVVVVTSSLDQGDAGKLLKRGVTCSSFCSVSVNPPIISFTLKQGSRMDDIVKKTKKFAVHMMAQNQVYHGMHFSKPAKSDVCQFDNIPHIEGDGGLPIILGSLAILLCETHSYHGVGDHTVWYGNVKDAKVSETLQEPLIYFTRKFRSIGDEIFLQAFEDTTLPFENWTHEAHLRMAWNYIRDYGKEAAVPHIKMGIKNFNEKNRDKIKTGYHETITVFFIHLVSDAIVCSVKADETFEEFLAEHSHLMDKDLILKYYSMEVGFNKGTDDMISYATFRYATSRYNERSHTTGLVVADFSLNATSLNPAPTVIAFGSIALTFIS